MSYGLRDTLRLINSDIEQRCSYEKKSPNLITKCKLFFHPGMATVALFRWQKYFDDSRLIPIAILCRWANLFFFTSSYASSAQVEEGFMVVHAVAIDIGNDVRIGARCILFGQNAIGPSPFLDMVDKCAHGAPIVDADVRFGVGACAYGSIKVGAHCNIGMSTLLEADAEAGTTLLGVPARVTATAAVRAK